MQKKNKYRFSEAEKPIEYIRWSQITLNVINLLNRVSDDESLGVFTATNLTSIVLLHQLFDQMINETLARRYVITLSVLNGFQGEAKIVGPPDEKHEAAAIMQQPLSSRSDKSAKYLQLVSGTQLPDVLKLKLFSFLILGISYITRI